MNGQPDGPVLEAKGLSKRFGPVVAADNVDLELRAGELLALIGDNGAGKSTLVKLLCGALQPDAGEILHHGQTVRFHTPLDARLSGIETIFQDLALAPNLDVAGNLFVGREEVYRIRWLPKILSPVNRKVMNRVAAQRIEELRVSVPSISKIPVERFSGGQRQAVAVARAASWATDVVFMDEPTAALGVAQSAAVLDLARRLTRRGLAVVLITHNLPQVMEAADRIVVLRQGRKIADLRREEATEHLLVSLIVGFGTGDQERPSSEP